MMAWNDERVAILKKMWLEGNSASEIAKELGNITRNAVIGKVHRLGLSNRDTNISKSGATPTKAVKNAKRGRPPKVSQEPKKRGRPQKPKGPTDFHEKINGGDQSISPSANSKLSNESNLEVVSDLSEETIKNLLKVEMKSKKRLRPIPLLLLALPTNLTRTLVCVIIALATGIACRMWPVFIYLLSAKVCQNAYYDDSQRIFGQHQLQISNV